MTNHLGKSPTVTRNQYKKSLFKNQVELKDVSLLQRLTELTLTEYSNDFQTVQKLLEHFKNGECSRNLNSPRQQIGTKIGTHYKDLGREIKCSKHQNLSNSRRAQDSSSAQHLFITWISHIVHALTHPVAVLPTEVVEIATLQLAEATPGYLPSVPAMIGPAHGRWLRRICARRFPRATHLCRQTAIYNLT